MSVLYVVIWLFVAWPIMTGMGTQWYQSVYHDSEACRQKEFRQSLGISVFFMFLLSPAWPITLLAIFCITGFAEHGVWRYK